MPSHRVEIPNYQPEQVAGHLDDALAIMAGTDVPEDLRVAAFAKTYELLATKQVVITDDAFAAAEMARHASQNHHASG